LQAVLALGNNVERRLIMLLRRKRFRQKQQTGALSNLRDTGQATDT
jgi:hypothetical protein